MRYDSYVGPQTPRYKGPVRDMIPEYGNGYVETFCPLCGGTEVENTGDRDRFRCLSCGAGFILGGPMTIDDDALYEISHRGSVQYEDIPRSDLRNTAWGTMLDGSDGCDTYANLARDYYGDIYAQYETEDAYMDPASAVSRQNLEMDIPYRELETAIDRGYIDGMSVGDSIHLPGTPLSIRRTRNIRKGRR